MAATGNVIVTGNVSNQPTGTRTFGPLTVSIPTAVDPTIVQALSVGANTVTLPVGITVAIITGPSAANPTPNPPYGGTLTLKGASGDTGIPFSSKNPQVLSWDTTTTAPTTIVINASAVCTVEVWCA